MRKILVTGGVGFIGGWVVDELKSRGYTPVIFDHQLRDKSEYPEGVEVILGDIRDEVAFTEAAAHVQGVIHLAAVLGTAETIDNPKPATLSNVEGGINFLEAITQYNLPAVYIAVGNRGMFATYSLTKSLVEDFCFMYNRYRGSKVNVLRVMNAFGPRQSAAEPFGPSKVRKVTPSFICRGLSGMPIEIYGGGTQTSDFVYVADVAKALVNCLEEADKGNVFDKTIEIGPREHKTVYEVAELIREYCADITNVAVELKSLPMRKGETPNAVVTADYHTLKLINMSHENLVPIEKGMRETVKWFHENEGITWRTPDVS